MPRSETERVRQVQDKQAPRYDRQISFFERVVSGDAFPVFRTPRGLTPCH